MDKADTSKVGAVQLLQRLRNNLTVRCVHHTDHFKHAFGKDAERVAEDVGTKCTWVGDLAAYEEHIRKGCPVESHLGGSALADSKLDGRDSSAVSETASVGGSPAVASAAVGSRLAESRPSTASPVVQAKEAQQGQAPPPPPKATASKTSGVSNRASGSGTLAPSSSTVCAESEDAREAAAIAVAVDQGEVRVARYDYNPSDDKAQIVLKANDFVRIFEVTESGWAAGVRLCKETMQEVGDAGWFPAGYLFPPDQVVAK